MNEYERKSQIGDYSRLPGILQAALQQEAQEYHCGQVPEDILMCIETVSVRKQAGIFTFLKNRFTGLPAPGAVQHCAAVVLPGWLIWAFTHWGRDDHATVLSVRLNEAEISDYRHSHLIEDDGLNILGFISDSTERSLYFLGLQQGEAAEAFKQFLQQVTQGVKAD